MRLPAPLAVLVGGSAGGAARMMIDEAVVDGSALPWEIMLINVLGSFALGVIAARVAVDGARWWTPLVTTGALGGFTTFSAIAALQWTADAPVAHALGGLLGSMAACIVAAAVGWRLGTATVRDTEVAVTDALDEDHR